MHTDRMTRSACAQIPNTSSGVASGLYRKLGVRYRKAALCSPEGEVQRDLTSMCTLFGTTSGARSPRPAVETAGLEQSVEPGSLGSRGTGEQQAVVRKDREGSG